MAQLTPDLTLHAVAPTDEVALREWFELDEAARAVDRPDDAPNCWTAHRAGLSAPWPGEEPRAWLARADGAVVGVGVLGLPMLDNTDNATGEIIVAPGHRRRGVARRILALLGDEARRARRVRLIVEARAPLNGSALNGSALNGSALNGSALDESTLDGSAAGPAFAAAAGAREVLVDIRRRLHLPGDEAAMLRLAEEATAASPGYDLVQWTDGTPPQWLDDIARLTGRMSTDAPLGDLHWAPEHYDAERVEARNAMCRAQGLSVTVTAARGPDGTLAAFTEIGVPATVREHAWNWDTLVAPEHRGRRLGMRVKLANLALARQRFPQVCAIDTVNAASNTHMIAINEAMGFRPHERLGEWELDL